MNNKSSVFKKRALVAVMASLMAASAKAEISDDKVVIGYMDDMSGPYSDLAGPAGQTAVEMAIEDFGGEVNGKPIELISSDHRNDPAVASNLAREWMDQDAVDMITGLNASSVAIAVSKLVEEKNKFAMVTTAAADSITGEHCTPNHVHWVYDTFAVSDAAARAIVEQGGESWFLMSSDYAFGHAMEAAVENAVEESGGTIAGKIRHPFPTDDFSSYILQAQGSGADIIGLASAGSDLINAIKTAYQFGVPQSGQTLASLMVFITDMHSLGLDVAQGTQFVTGWYWDMDDQAREWAERFQEREGRMPTMIQAGNYSAVTHYLQAVEATGSDDPEDVRQYLMENPIEDFFARNGRLREDGRMVHDMYLAEVKSPEESTGEWDLYEIKSTIPAEEAFRPLSESQCDLVNN
ncbi:ABC transporter substrate-binding protein [Halomonas cerina]|uniref:Branched-chain amino acid transport system substrate-binding protein n=1 Tax=Halomonas cerina TaxID=447424 RepID=A0A839VD53_9GAMM|nr:ABC transporter substrate-binding protein [Halomonas cerina]MBB3191965.1 branched-chain amino acid transport system substrate-binding protein [Halomonas cerina]